MQIEIKKYEDLGNIIPRSLYLIDKYEILIKKLNYLKTHFNDKYK